MTKAFDLALFVGTPTNVGDAPLISALGPPFVAQFAPVVQGSKPGLVVGASVPAATAKDQILVAGPGPAFNWILGVQGSAAVTSVAGRAGDVVLTHTDITDWSASLAPYALSTSIPLASGSAPAMDSAASAGSSVAFSRGDHVHPTDTSRYAASNPSGYQTAGQVGAAIAASAYTLPTASMTTLGGVKVDGSTVTISGGVISAAASAYTLPTASMTTLGGVKVDGSTVTISGGVISAVGGGGGGDGSGLPLTGGTLSGPLIINTATQPELQLMWPQDTTVMQFTANSITLNGNGGPAPATSNKTTLGVNAVSFGHKSYNGGNQPIALSQSNQGEFYIALGAGAPFPFSDLKNGHAIRVSSDAGNAITYGADGSIFAPAGGGGGGLADAPSDGTGYVRQDGAWSNVFDAGTF